LEELALIHTHAPEKVEELRDRARHLFPGGREPIEIEATPVIGAHIGPGAAGFACVAAGSRPTQTDRGEPPHVVTDTGEQL
jgi:fatty acid-binding protein DegV